MVGMGVREHDRGRQQAPETIPPVEAAVDHHLAAAVPDEQGAVPAMPARSRLDLAPRSEKAKPHRPRWAPRPATPRALSRKQEARASRFGAYARFIAERERDLARARRAPPLLNRRDERREPGDTRRHRVRSRGGVVEHSRLRAAAAQEARQARTLGTAVNP